MPIVLSVALGFGLVNVMKPVHIDDALYLAIAKQIVHHPLDPYGGLLNWQRNTEPTYKVSISPPLLNYYFAGVIAVFGEAETILHAAMLPWVLLAGWGVLRVSEQTVGRSDAVRAALLVAASPAFTVGINLMLDLPLLAAMLLSAERMLAACQHKRVYWAVALAAFWGGVAVLIKYPALSLVALALALAWESRRPVLALAALGPLAGFVGWQVASSWLYEVSQAGEGMSFLSRFQFDFLKMSAQRSFDALVILSLVFPIWVAKILAPRRRQWTIAVLIMAVTILIPTWPMVVKSPGFLLNVVLAALGLASIGFVLVGVWNHAKGAATGGRPESRPPDRFLISQLIWCLAHCGFVVVFSPFVAVRSLLPALLPLALGQVAGRSSPRGDWTVIVLSLGLSGLLAWTDFRWASVYPPAVEQLSRRYAPADQPVFFLGHWGWQYYAEKRGFRPWDADRSEAPAGAIVIIPREADANPFYIHPAIRERLEFVERLSLPPHPCRLTTWNLRSNIRFYGGTFGQLPWGFSRDPTEEFVVLRYNPDAAGAGR